MKFQPGTVVITPGCLQAFETSGDDPLVFILRHVQGDWGDLSPEDIAENELSLREGFRLLSAYTLSNGTKVWIITEATRESTCLLLPEEY